MYSLGVLCLLSAAVALPTPENLHTNLPDFPPSPELKSEEKDNSSDVLVKDEPVPSTLDMPESKEANNPLESAEKPKAEEDADKIDDTIKVIQKEPKESKESKEPWEPKEFEERPGELMGEKKEKDSKSEELKEVNKEGGPVIVHVMQSPPPKGFIPEWLPIPNFHLPWPSSYFGSKLHNGGQKGPFFIIKEPDFAFHDL